MDILRFIARIDTYCVAIDIVPFTYRAYLISQIIIFLSGRWMSILDGLSVDAMFYSTRSPTYFIWLELLLQNFLLLFCGRNIYAYYLPDKPEPHTLSSYIPRTMMATSYSIQFRRIATRIFGNQSYNSSHVCSFSCCYWLLTYKSRTI